MCSQFLISPWYTDISWNFAKAPPTAPTTQYSDIFPAAHFEVSASKLVLTVASPGA